MRLRSALTVIAAGALLASGLATQPAHADEVPVPPVARVSCLTSEQATAAWGKKLTLAEVTPDRCSYEEPGVEFGGLSLSVGLGTPTELKEEMRASWPEDLPYSFDSTIAPVPALGADAFLQADASAPTYYWQLTPGVTASLIGNTWAAAEAANIRFAKAFRPMMEVYTVDGERTVNGRQWRTRCEMYSTTVARCYTDIWGTTITKQGGRYVQTNGWVFNSLTYRWSDRAQWTGNPLGNTNADWTSKGRQWRTECDTPATGRGACRSYILATVVSFTGSGYKQEDKWIFNNMVLFS